MSPRYGTDTRRDGYANGPNHTPSAIWRCKTGRAWARKPSWMVQSPATAPGLAHGCALELYHSYRERLPLVRISTIPAVHQGIRSSASSARLLKAFQPDVTRRRRRASALVSILTSISHVRWGCWWTLKTENPSLVSLHFARSSAGHCRYCMRLACLPDGGVNSSAPLHLEMQSRMISR